MYLLFAFLTLDSPRRNTCEGLARVGSLSKSAVQKHVPASPVTALASAVCL